MTNVWVVEMSGGPFGTFWPKAVFTSEEKAVAWVEEWQRDADDKGSRESFRVHGAVSLDPTGYAT